MVKTYPYVLLSLIVPLLWGCPGLFYDYKHRELTVEWNPNAATLYVDDQRIDQAPYRHDFGRDGTTKIYMVPNWDEGFYFVSWEFSYLSWVEPDFSTTANPFRFEVGPTLHFAIPTLRRHWYVSDLASVGQGEGCLFRLYAEGVPKYLYWSSAAKTVTYLDDEDGYAEVVPLPGGQVIRVLFEDHQWIYQLFNPATLAFEDLDDELFNEIGYNDAVSPDLRQAVVVHDPYVLKVTNRSGGVDLQIRLGDYEDIFDKVVWSDDSKGFLFTTTQNSGLRLYYCNVTTGQSRAIYTEDKNGKLSDSSLWDYCFSGDDQNTVYLVGGTETQTEGGTPTESSEWCVSIDLTTDAVNTVVWNKVETDYGDGIKQRAVPELFRTLDSTYATFGAQLYHLSAVDATLSDDFGSFSNTLGSAGQTGAQGTPFLSSFQGSPDLYWRMPDGQVERITTKEFVRLQENPQ